VALPVTRSDRDRRLRQHGAARPVFLERDEDAAGEVVGLELQRSVVGDSRADGNPRLMEAVPLDHAVARVDPERVLDGFRVELVEPDGEGDRVVPVKALVVVVDAVVGIALPRPRQADRVRRLVEAAVAYQLGGEPALDALVHVLDELPVEPRVDPALELRGVHHHARRRRLRVRARAGADEQRRRERELRPRARQGFCTENV
jgi:hypothetical protein